MKSPKQNKGKIGIWLLFMAGFLLTFWSWSIGKVEQKKSLKSENKEIANKISKVLEEKRNQANVISTLLPKESKVDIQNSEFFKKIKKNNLEAFVYRNDSIVWWSNNHLHQGYSLKDTGHFVMKEFKSWYQVSVFHPDSNTTLLLVFEIYKDYPIYNRLFQPSLSTSFKIRDQTNVAQDSIGNIDFAPVLTNDNKTMFFVGIVKKQVDYNGAWLCLFGFLLLGFCLFSWFYKFESKLNIAFHSSFLALFAIFRFLLFFKVLSIGQNDMQLFSPEIYASSWYFPSLGELLLHQILAIVALNLLFRIKQHYSEKISQKQNVALTLISGFAYFCIVNFCFSEMAKLVIDSHIGFNFYEIDSINIFTLIGLISVFLVFQMLNILRNLLVWLNFPKTKWYVLLISILLPALLFFIFYHNTLLIIGVSSLYCLVYLFNPAEIYLKGRMFRFPIRLVVACFFVTLIFVDFQVKKEQDFRKLIANKVLYKNEVEPIGFLSKIETQLANDQGIVDFFTCTDIDKTNFEQRLKSIYFSKKMSDFDLFVLDFDTLGKAYSNGSIFDYQGIYSIYTSNICKPVTKYFSQLYSPKFKGSYVGFFTPNTKGVKHGYLFIILKPRFGAQAGRYEDVFAPSFNEISNNKNYSYAIYENSRLSQRFGSYGYELDLNKNFIAEKFITEGDNSHYVTGDSKGSLVVLSKHENLLWHFFTNFTFLVVISIFGALLVLGTLSIVKYLSERLVHKRFFASLNLLLLKKIELFDTRNLFLSSKIQFSMVAVVFITFIITVNVTINYIRTNYNQRQNEFLLNKLYSIGNSLNNQSDINDLLSMYRYGLIYNLSNYNNIDINIYDINGKLLHTSNDKIFEEGFIGNMMESNAYHELKELKKSEFFQTETLGTLSFLSGYHALLDNDLKVRGFLHLPYFSKSKDLNKEIASYIVALVNLFAIVFAVSALVAWLLSKRISQPLNLIRKNLGVLKLGGANTQIPWKNNDEIGLLIAEYNKMIEQLEDSSNKLASSEREGAWREMAKQVAHEIKNPLTPMKLSLQHLQHAIARNDADIEQKVNRTTKLLIDQIDSLSRMAEEFSTFAKMPDAMPEEMDFNKAIKHCCELFKQETGFKIDIKEMYPDALIKADNDQLNRVITNIIKNAQQAIPENRNGILEVALKRIGNNYIAEFTDNGKGIEQELLNKIFSPNFSTKSSGMGLGLAISKKIIETFKGALYFDTKIDVGTTFYIMLPAVK